MKLTCKLCGHLVEVDPGPEQFSNSQYYTAEHLQKDHTKDELAAFLRGGGRNFWHVETYPISEVRHFA
jgi:hypothetical protein